MEKKVDIFLIFVLSVLQVQKAISYHLLREAARLFQKRGYMAFTLRELSKRFGVQGGNIYHHFSSKEGILYEIMDDTVTKPSNLFS